MGKKCAFLYFSFHHTKNDLTLIKQVFFLTCRKHKSSLAWERKANIVRKYLCRGSTTFFSPLKKGLISKSESCCSSHVVAEGTNNGARAVQKVALTYDNGYQGYSSEYCKEAHWKMVSLFFAAQCICILIILRKANSLETPTNTNIMVIAVISQQTTAIVR